MTTIEWVDGRVRILDQTRLPAEELMIDVDDVDELIAHIRRLAVRGAMALGVAGAMGMALAALASQRAGTDLDEDLHRAARRLEVARPTAVNLSWGVRRVLAARGAGADAAGLVAEALRVRDEDRQSNAEVSERGAEMLAGSRRVLTHCNAGALAGAGIGTALGVIQRLHRACALDTVYVCETRPLLQGVRLTAWELGRAGIPHRVIVDSAAAGLILGGEVDAVVVGADRITACGDVINKVGTLAHALSAQRAGIPFVVAAPESTVDLDLESGADVPIELRDEREVLEPAGVPVAPAGTAGWNPAFDITPADLVTAVVTDRRVIRGRTDTDPAAPRPGRQPRSA